MNRVLVLVEGQTERIVVDQFLNPHFNLHGVWLYPRIVGKPGHKGGVRAFEGIKRELCNLIKSDRTCAAVTTFFDYYALPSSWPGVAAAKGQLCNKIPGHIEPKIAEAIQQELDASFNPGKFIPYVQMHELEALFFADPEALANIFGDKGLSEEIKEIVTTCGGCEAIDDGPTTAPSKRVKALFPQYKKGQSLNAHAPKILKAIGIQTVRAQCPHFNEWCTKLEQLSP